MTKSELKTGMQIELKNGKRGMILLGTVNGDIISGDAWSTLDCYTEELRFNGWDGAGDLSWWDIVAIYQPTCIRGYHLNKFNNTPCIWTREESR